MEIYSFRKGELRHPEKFIRECSGRQWWIVEKWSKYFTERGVPHVVHEVGGRRWIEKDCEWLKAEDFWERGWVVSE